MRPADQRFDPLKTAATEGEKRLIKKLERPVIERLAQARLKAAGCPELDIHVRGVASILAAPTALGAVECYVSIAQQLIKVGRVVRKNRDSDAGAVVQTVALDKKRLVQCINELLGDDCGATAVDQIGLDDDELVAADPSERIRRAHAAGKPRGDFLQQAVADRMAEGV